MRNINPSIKAAVILLCGLIISFSYSLFWNSIIIGICLILLFVSGVSPKKIAAVLLPATLAAASIFMAFVIHGNGEAVSIATDSKNFLQVSAGAGKLSDAAALALRIYAYAALGMLFSFTTDANEFLYSLMQQCHLAPKFAYGVLAAYHLLPVALREYRQIRLAFEVRGCHLAPWSLKPAFPALVNAMHWAENIAMAMESKGFDENGERTWYLTTSVHPADFLWSAFMIGICTAGIVL
ncbi:MAG: energy-coupling factor transporter transmembrane protein EcfT [Clostridiales bacterium]|nr:energy-coupling factor transporter transmembrane protein EcfT [Clostridiales bacterium]